MIKRLDSKYEKKVIDYLNIEKEINTFNLQELKNYGFDNVFYKVYSDIDEDGNIKGILFKCFEYLTFYSYGEFYCSCLSFLYNDRSLPCLDTLTCILVSIHCRVV